MLSKWPSLITGNGIELNEICPSSLGVLERCHANEAVRGFVNTKHKTTMQELLEWFAADYFRENHVVYIIGDGLGYTTASKSPKPEIGIVLLPEFRGKGIAAAAWHAMCRTGFSVGIRKIVARTLPSNDHCAILLKKLGFTYEGHLRKDLYLNGGFHDVHFYGLFENELKDVDAPKL